MSNKTRAQELRKMRVVASGLLLAMTGIFVISIQLRPTHPWLEYVIAFAEAAMIGGLADWFAVSALFRHPLGLPIPHTAVIPKNKDRIGKNLGEFIEEHFFPPEIISAKLAQMDIAGTIAHWTEKPDNANAVSEHVLEYLPDIINALDDDEMRRFIRDKLTAQLENIDGSPLAGGMLSALTANNQHQALLDEMIKRGLSILLNKESMIRQKIRESTHWIWQKLSLDERAFNAIVKALEEILNDIKKNPEHELRQQFDNAVQTLIDNLQNSQQYRDQIESSKHDLVHSPILQHHLFHIWDNFKQRILLDAQAPQSEIKSTITAALIRLSRSVATDAALREKLNHGLGILIGKIMESSKHQIPQLIAATVHSWNTKTMVERLELQVGKDLQFIRVNGTLVGGVIGLAIHLFSHLAA